MILYSKINQTPWRTVAPVWFQIHGKKLWAEVREAKKEETLFKFASRE